MDKLTKKELVLKTELSKLVEEFGYWSKEVYDFNNKLDYHTCKKLNLNINK